MSVFVRDSSENEHIHPFPKTLAFSYLSYFFIPFFLFLLPRFFPYFIYGERLRMKLFVVDCCGGVVWHAMGVDVDIRESLLLLYAFGSLLLIFMTKQ